MFSHYYRKLRNKSYKEDLVHGFSYHQLETEVEPTCHVGVIFDLLVIC